MLMTLRNLPNSSYSTSNAIKFVEGITGLSFMVNPECEKMEFMDIDFECTEYKEVDHDKYMICQAASEVVWNDDWNFWICTAKFDGDSLYDLSPNIIMKQMKNGWYRDGLLSLAKTNSVVNDYLKHWMGMMCDQVQKSAKKIRKMRKKKLLVDPRFMVDSRLLIKQYGLFLGFNIWGTLNPNGQKQQQTKYIKFPILIYNKWTDINDFISTPALCYTKNKTDIYNVDEHSGLFEWLGIQYVLRKNDLGLWSPIQNQLSYNKKTQVLMLKYDVALQDSGGNVFYIYRDLNAENPNGPFAFDRLCNDKRVFLTFGYVNKYFSNIIAVSLIKLCAIN